MNLRVYIGFDERLNAAWEVAARSFRRFDCSVVKLQESVLRMAGMLTRPVDRRDSIYDFNSNAPQSTEFANARFWVPLLAHSGWAMFADSDVIALADPQTLMNLADPTKAVMVVKHHPIRALDLDARKMDGQAQTIYERKLWSSVALWNCDHPANRRLNLMMLNQWPGRDLHAFKFLADSEIGDLPSRWNHLVGIDPPRIDPAIVHFTEGTPDLPGYEHCEYAAVWREMAAA